MTRTGGDPVALHALARHGAGQAFTLDRCAGEVAAFARAPVDRTLSRQAQHVARRVRGLGHAAWTLDRWVGHVAALLEVADSPRRRLAVRLVALGPNHPAAALAAHAVTSAGPPPTGPSSPALTGADWLAVAWEDASDESLAEVASWPGLPTVTRDRVARVRAARHLQALGRRIEQQRSEVRRLRASRGRLDRIAVWIDRVVLRRIDAVTVLHVSAEDALANLERERDGLRWVLRQPHALLLDFAPVSDGPDGQPTLRVALRDPVDVSHVALLVPGTASGVGNPAPAFADLVTLQAALDDAPHIAPDREPVVVLDLYDAPDDLGRAADPAHGDAAGADLARFITQTWVSPHPTVTLVGHSYGAFTAARAAAAGAAVDRVLALGAPGLGVLHADQLGLPPDAVVAALAPGDPVALVADLDELIAGLPQQHQDRLGPLTNPLAALGPDPTDPEFGARRLDIAPTPDLPGHAVRGHLDYLAPGSASLRAVTDVILEPRR